MPSLLRRHHTAWRREKKCIGLSERDVCRKYVLSSWFECDFGGHSVYEEDTEKQLLIFTMTVTSWGGTTTDGWGDSFLDWLTTLAATTTRTSLVIIYLFVEVVRYSGSPLISISCKLLLRDFSSSLAIAVVIKTVALRMDQEARLTVRDVVHKGYNLSFSVVRERRKIPKHKKP